MSSLPKLLSHLALALVVAGCATGIDSPISDEGPDAGSSKFDDPDPPDDDPDPDAGVDYPCGGGTVNFEDPATGHCYMYFDTQVYWDNARSNCEILPGNARLVSIDSAEENELVLSAIGNRRAWMGATDANNEGTWSWITSEPFNYTNWRSGEPNNGNGNEDCAVIEGDRNGQWDDRNCTSTQRYVCERP